MTELHAAHFACEHRIHIFPFCVEMRFNITHRKVLFAQLFLIKLTLSSPSQCDVLKPQCESSVWRDICGKIYPIPQYSSPSYCLQMMGFNSWFTNDHFYQDLTESRISVLTVTPTEAERFLEISSVHLSSLLETFSFRTPLPLKLKPQSH